MKKLFNKVICFFFGHDDIVHGVMSDIAAARDCDRCGRHIDAIVWPRPPQAAKEER